MFRYEQISGAHRSRFTGAMCYDRTGLAVIGISSNEGRLSWRPLSFDVGSRRTCDSISSKFWNVIREHRTRRRRLHFLLSPRVAKETAPARGWLRWSQSLQNKCRREEGRHDSHIVSQSADPIKFCFKAARF